MWKSPISCVSRKARSRPTFSISSRSLTWKTARRQSSWLFASTSFGNQREGMLCWLLVTSVHRIRGLHQYNRSHLPSCLHEKPHRSGNSRGCHFLDQADCLGRQPWLSRNRLGCMLPEHVEKLPMPAQLSLWLDKVERLFPAPTPAGDAHSQQS